MKNISNKLTHSYFFYGLVTLGLIIFCVFNNPVFYPDSQGYIEMDLIRSLGYPFFLEFHKFIFGTNYLTFVIISQLTINLFSIFYFKNCLSKTIKLKNEYLGIVFLILCIPIVYEQKVVNSILSEALAYPLYLLVIGTFLQATLLKKFNYFYYSIIITFLLIQIRTQFLFLIPLFLICTLLFEYKNFKKKETILLLFTIICIPFLSIFIDITFHKLKHNQNTTTPWTGVQIAAMPFFVSDKNDSLAFEDKNQEAYFNLIYSKLEQKKLLLKFLPKENYYTIDFYSERYIPISISTVNSDGELFFNSSFSLNQKTILNNKMATSMVVPLIKNNFFKYSKLYSQNVIKGVGSSKHFVLILILLLLSLIKNLKSPSNNLKFIIITTISFLGNIFIVAFAEPTISRYVFYNNWVLITIILLLFQNIFSTKTNGYNTTEILS